MTEAVDAAAEPDGREILATSESAVCVDGETVVDRIRLFQFQTSGSHNSGLNSETGELIEAFNTKGIDIQIGADA